MTFEVCPFECFYNGVCEQGECKCFAGWTGKFCNISIPFNDSNHYKQFAQMIVISQMVHVLLKTQRVIVQMENILFVITKNAQDTVHLVPLITVTALMVMFYWYVLYCWFFFF
jgi:hypothetical protein